MREHFIPQDGVHTYNTRLSSKGVFVIPKIKSNGLQSFCYNGSSIILLQMVFIHSATTGLQSFCYNGSSIILLQPVFNHSATTGLHYGTHYHISF